MDVIGYRNSGELSDITVVIDGEEFHLHKFPLFVRSFYFKNLTLDSSKVELNNFPGGSKIFAIVADYCYNKEVHVDQENVIQVRCAAEYLKMTVSGSSCSGLALLAENILFDLTYSAKGKKDYQSILLLLKKASEFKDLAEKCLINRKIIDSFVENLAVYVKSANLYDSIGLYDKSPSLFAPKKSLHSLSLNNEQLNIINKLPLKWMNDLIRSAVRFNLNQTLLCYIIQNYIDYNTQLNPHYNQAEEKSRSRKQSNQSDESSQSEKVPNLIKMAGDILKAEVKFENLTNEVDQKPSNLINIAGDILDKNESPKAMNLIRIANDILKVEDKLSELVNSAENDVTAEEDSTGASNLIKMAGDILEPDKKLENENTLNLMAMASDILRASNKFEKLADDTPDEIDDENSSPVNLIGIADAVLNENKKTLNLINIADDILVSKTATPKPQLSSEEKLEIITNLTNTIVELRYDPKFPISWLLIYLNALHDLNADSSVKSIYNRWAWNAINDLKSNSQELSAIPPSLMIKMVQDISAYDDISNNEYEKLNDLTDRYIADLSNDNKLNSDLFLQLLSCIPKDKRNNFDAIAAFVVNIFEKDQNINSEMQSKLLSLIDFQRINEKTLKLCQNSQFVPRQFVSEAALSLCFKLREELDEAKLTIKSFEIKSSLSKNTAKPTYSSGYTSKYTKTDSVTLRNRSIEPKANSNSKLNLQKSSEKRLSQQPTSYSTASTTYATATQPTSYNSTTTATKGSKHSSYPTTSTTSSTSYHTNYSTSLTRDRRYSSPMRTGLSTVLNSTYKSSNYNPSPSTTKPYLNSGSYHHNTQQTYIDYLADDYSYDYIDRSYLDDNNSDYYCSTHSYPYYSRIY